MSSYQLDMATEGGEWKAVFSGGELEQEVKGVDKKELRFRVRAANRAGLGLSSNLISTAFNGKGTLSAVIGYPSHQTDSRAEFKFVSNGDTNGLIYFLGLPSKSCGIL